MEVIGIWWLKHPSRLASPSRNRGGWLENIFYNMLPAMVVNIARFRGDPYLLQSSSAASDSGFAVGCLVLVDNTLGDSLV